MKIFGIETGRAGKSADVVRGALSIVMMNPRISIDSGMRIIQMYLDGRIDELQVHRYNLSRDTSDVVTDNDIFDHLDAWQDKVGPFSAEDFDYLHSLGGIPGYQAKPKTIRGIADYISCRVIGQDEAIDSIVSTAWLHVNSVRRGLGIKPPALLLVGQSGVGKNQILLHLADILNVPVINVFASTLTAPGYKGGDSIIDQVASQYGEFASKYDSLESEPVLVIVHEIDKAMRGNNDGYRVELLSSIMSLIEKTTIYKPNAIGKSQKIDLKNFLLVFDGCFDGIEKVVARRLGAGRVGFNQGGAASLTDLRKKITKADLLEYGVMPEFIGRLGEPVCLNNLSHDMLYDILTRSLDSPVAAYVKAFGQFGIKLRFSREALKAMADVAFENCKFGARALESVVSAVMQPFTLLLESKSKDNVTVGKRDVCRIIGNRRKSL